MPQSYVLTLDPAPTAAHPSAPGGRLQRIVAASCNCDVVWHESAALAAWMAQSSGQSPQ